MYTYNVFSPARVKKIAKQKIFFADLLTRFPNDLVQPLFLFVA